jgi:hypothetical protein
MNYKFLFLVGSALNHFQGEHFSFFSKEQRFLQTLDTIQSIKEKVPDAYICIYEGSETPIDEEYRKKFLELSDLFVECYDDFIMQQVYQNLHNSPDRFVYGKSMLECRCIQITLNTIQEKNIFNDIRRVFKITSRYKLNEEFNIDDYKTNFLTNKYVMKYFNYKERFFDDENLYANLYGCKGNVVTGLWSFDRFLFNDVQDLLTKSFSYMEQAIQFTAGIDIEHSFYHFLDKDKILNVPVLGLTVVKGMDGETYNI